MMSRIKHALFVVFAIVLLASALVGASNSGGGGHLSPEAQQFRELLDTLDAATLHDILHEHFKDKYQHGVYQQDKSALEALHRQNAEVATSLVRLARRQSPDVSNGSSVVTTTAVTETTIEVTITSTGTSSPPDQPTPTPTPTPSQTPSAPTEPETSPTPSSTVPDPPTPTTTPDVPTSSIPVEPTTSSEPSASVPTTLTSSTTPASPTTSSGTSTSPLNTSSSSNLASTSSSDSISPSASTPTSSTLLTTTSRTASSGVSRPAATEDVTTSIVYTTTLANGAAVVTTQYTVVPADQVAQPTGSGGSSTNTAKASLQTGLANSQYQRGGLTMGLGFLGMVVACGL